MLVRVELLAVDGGVEPLHAVLLECLHEDGLGHLKAIVQVDEVLVARLQLLGGNVGKGAVKVVDAVHEVLGETLDGEVLRSLHLALRLVLQVAEVGDAVLELVLYDSLARCRLCAAVTVYAYGGLEQVLLLGLELCFDGVLLLLGLLLLCAALLSLLGLSLGRIRVHPHA